MAVNNRTIEITLQSKNDSISRPITFNNTIVGGWTGRDREAMEHHMVEMEAIGVSRPSTTPVFYRVSTSRLTNAERIQVAGTGSSGEVEYTLLKIDGELWVGTASDHTDRDVESYGITVAKQMCDKPIANIFWPYSEVSSHWDVLQLTSHIVVGGKRATYQQGTLAGLLVPDALLGEFDRSGMKLSDGDFMFGGTLPTIGKTRTAERFEFELYDPVLERRISHGYDIEPLPILG